MSAPASCCNPCCDETQIVDVPGVQGEPGANGTNGNDGVNAFTLLTNDFLIPPKGDAVAGVKVANSSWMVVGQYVYVLGAGIFQVLSITDSTTVSLVYQNYAINTHSGDTATNGSQVSPSGNQVTVTGISDFVDNTEGIASSTLAAGVGRTTLVFYIEAASIANGDLLTNYVPGYAFKILKFDARCAKTVSTGAKASNLNIEIGTTDLTGGVIALAGTYAIGAAQAGSVISGANIGTPSDSFSIEASSTTAFIEGAFWLLVELQNLDTTNAVASLADKTNNLLAALGSLMSSTAATTKVYYDVLTSFEQGVNSGITPILLPKNQLAFALNSTVRGGNVAGRPPVQIQTLNFNHDEDLQTAVLNGFFQGSGIYRPDFGPTQIIAQISGRLFAFTPTSTDWVVTEISIPGDLNSPSAIQVWMWQSEKWLIINDGTGALPIFYDGVSCRRSLGASQAVANVIAAAPGTAPAIGGTVTLTLDVPYNGPQTVIFNGTYYQVSYSGAHFQVDLAIAHVFQSNAANNRSNPDFVPMVGMSLYAYPSRVAQLMGTGTPGTFYGNYIVSQQLPVLGSPGVREERILSLDFNIKHGLGVNDQILFGGKAWTISAVLTDFSVDVKRTMSVGEPVGPIYGPPFYPGQQFQNGTIVELPSPAPAVKVGTITQIISQTSSVVPYFGVSYPVVRVELDTSFNYPENSIMWINTTWNAGAGYPLTMPTACYVALLVNGSSAINSVTLTNISDTDTNPYVLPQSLMSVPELPPGRMGAYGMGRNWMSLIDGISYIAGDIVGGASGSAVNGYRDSVLKTTENDFLAGGGTFRLPGSGNIINSMTFMATLDASQGQGALQIGTDTGMFSNNTPTDRDTWANLTNPILTESLIGLGPLAQNSTVLANSDILFRSIEGLASLVIARRNFGQWGNTPISREMEGTFRADNPNLLIFGSAVVFDNRLLMTVSPTANGTGTYHRGVSALNFDTISSILTKSPPVYDGLWTGLNILQFMGGNFSGTGRSFAFSYDLGLGQLELYELLTTIGGHHFDNGDTRVKWIIETPVLFNRDVKPMSELIRLLDAEMYVQDVDGDVHVKVEYRPDFYPCWVLWKEFDICANRTVVDGKPGYRTRLSLGDPPDDTCDEANDNRLLRVGHFFQFRFTFTGYLKLMGFRVAATTDPAPDFAPPQCAPVCEETIPMPQ